MNWLLTGRGTPYIKEEGKAEKQAPEEKPAHEEIQEPGRELSLKIPDLLKKTIEILESRTIYGTALSSNINAFFQSIQAERNRSKMEARIAHLEKLLDDLAEKFTRSETNRTPANMQGEKTPENNLAKSA